MGLDNLRIRKSVPYVAILLLSLLLTTLFFSNLLTRNVGEEVALDLSDIIIDGGNVTYSEGSLLVSENGSIRFKNLSLETKNVKIIFQPEEGYEVQRGVSGHICVRDEGNSAEDVVANHYVASPSGKYNAVTVKVDSNGLLNELTVNFTVNVPDKVSYHYQISDIILNAHEPVQFSFFALCVIFVVLTAIYLIWKYKVHTINYDSKNRRHKGMICLVVVLNMVIVCSVGYYLRDVEEDPNYLNYYDDIMASYTTVGVLAISESPPEELLELENPYDYSLRTEDGIEYPFDVAYYNGNYYIYFGFAPLLMLYVPYFHITGGIAPPALIITFLAVIAVIGLGLLLMEVIRKFRIQANLLLLLLIQFALPFCVLLHLIQVNVNIYYIAALSGITGLIWFLFFAFRAARDGHPVRRRLFFACTGAALVMMVASRPAITLLAAAVIPLFLEVLWDKKRRGGAKALDVVTFIAPVLIGAAGIMYYNWIRFDSVFEFGATYQLTVNDIRYQTVELSVQNFVNTIIYYFFYPLSLSTVFPYVSMTRPLMSIFGNYLYRDATVGVFGIPYYLPLFLLPAVRFQNKTERWTVILILASAFILAYVNFCVAGVIVRYACDLLVPLALVTAIVILKLAKPGGKLYGVILCLIAASLVVGVSLIFTNERNYYQAIQADLYVAAKNFFSLY